MYYEVQNIISSLITIFNDIYDNIFNCTNVFEKNQNYIFDGYYVFFNCIPN